MIPYRNMPTYLDRCTQVLPDYLRSKGLDFNLLVVEQGPSARPFNLGRIINVGYDLYKQGELGYVWQPGDVFNWYPADCLPIDIDFTMGGNDFIVFTADDHWYGKTVSFRNDIFEKVNGFGNNYWAHGREDDDMYLRLRIHNAQGIRRPCKLEFIPHEPRDTSHRASTSDIYLRRLADTGNYLESGLNTLDYKVLDRRKVNGVDLVTVFIW